MPVELKCSGLGLCFCLLAFQEFQLLLQTLEYDYNSWSLWSTRVQDRGAALY